MLDLGGLPVGAPYLLGSVPARLTLLLHKIQHKAAQQCTAPQHNTAQRKTKGEVSRRCW